MKLLLSTVIAMSWLIASATEPCITNIVFTPTTTSPNGCGSPFVSVKNSQGYLMPKDGDHWDVLAFESHGDTNVCVTGSSYWNILFTFPDLGGCCEISKPLGVITWYKNGVQFSNTVTIPAYKLEGIVVIHNPGTNCDSATVATCIIAPTCEPSGGDD